MTYERCGFQIYHTSFFYGIAWHFYKDSFDPSPVKIDKIMEILTRKNTTILHFNNNLSKNMKIEKDKPVAYTKLAQMYCPRVYETVNIYF